jgi:hypothetical protein
MKALKALSLILIVAFTLALGYTMGRADTIHQAELISVDDHEYHISFGDEIHTYTFE